MELASKILKGNVAAAARLIRGIEDELPDVVDDLQSIYPHTGRAAIVGITGAPGAGKSTVVDSLVSIFRRRDLTVGVVAVDPTSPFSGGAILGDRIRMQQHNLDKGVFIRSLATRGWAGGLSKATMNTVHVMDAMGKDIVLVETVGTGQAEIDIVRVADTTVLVLTPETGDEIQMMKAGILEATDIFIINKADREGADNLKRGLEVMLGMKECPPGGWQPSIFLTEAISDKGTEELADEIMRHREFLISSGGIEKCRRERARLELTAAIEGSLKDYVYRSIDKDNYLEKLINSLVNRETNPHAAAQEIIEQFSKEMRYG